MIYVTRQTADDPLPGTPGRIIRIPQGQALEDARREAGHSQRAFAALLGISQAHLSRMERSHCPVSDRVAERIAEHLGDDWDRTNENGAARIPPGSAPQSPSPQGRPMDSPNQTNRHRPAAPVNQTGAQA